MVESINTKVDLTVSGTSYMGLSDYGKILIGDKGFEFFNDRDVRKYIQIPWNEVDVIVASVMFKGRWIPRFGIRTKKNGMFTFSAKDPKRVLRAIRNYIPADRMVRSLTFSQVLRRNIKNLFNRKNK